MKKIRSSIAAIGVASLVMVSLEGVQPARAAGADTTEQSSMGSVAKELKAGPAPRDVVQVDGGQKITYHLNGGATATFFYDRSGTPMFASEKPAGQATPQVSAGLDPKPYVDLDSAEQGAAAAGTAGALTAAICVALGPETGGVGCVLGAGVATTVVAVAAAHGVCPNGQKMRIYPTTRGAKCLS